jgi:hypothetical protein
VSAVARLWIGLVGFLFAAAFIVLCRANHELAVDLMPIGLLGVTGVFTAEMWTFRRHRGH